MADRWMTSKTCVMLVGVLLTCVLVGQVTAQSHDVEVWTKYGGLYGSSREVHGVKLYTFLGVPYAKPPTGSLRFRPPYPRYWGGVWKAWWFGPACPQGGKLPSSLQVDEDCLYLNIYTPQINPSVNLPVMVYIHGGSYIEGSGSLMNSSMLSLPGVVTVTINYRLGVLGFLSTGDSVAPGNLGLLDQLAAIKWVTDCIIAFGGDPNQVTIFGESAGASSVSLHLLSPVSKGYHRAICESGDSLVPWAAILPSDSPSPRKMAFTLGENVGCHSNKSSELLTCLRSHDAMVLVDASLKVKGPLDRLIWSPVVETVYGFLPDTPENLVRRGKFKRIPVIRGTNKEEDAFAGTNIPGIAKGVSLDYLLNDINNYVKERCEKGVSPVVDEIKRVYVNTVNTSDPTALRESLIVYHSDHDFVAPTVLETQNVSASSSQTYMYTFNYRSPNSFRPSWMGVPHTAELPYVFGAPLGDDPFFEAAWPTLWTNDDKQVSRNMIEMWTNFAKYGDPTPQPIGGAKWLKFINDQAYLYIGKISSLQNALRPSAMAIWNRLIPKEC